MQGPWWCWAETPRAEGHTSWPGAKRMLWSAVGLEIALLIFMVCTSNLLAAEAAAEVALAAPGSRDMSHQSFWPAFGHFITAEEGGVWCKRMSVPCEREQSVALTQSKGNRLPNFWQNIFYYCLGTCSSLGSEHSRAGWVLLLSSTVKSCIRGRHMDLFSLVSAPRRT